MKQICHILILFLLFTFSSLHAVEFANFVEIGSIFGGLGLGAPQSTSDVIFSTRTGSSVLSGRGVFYNKVSSDSTSPVLFPQIGYGFSLNKKFIWDFNVIANKTNILNQYFAGTNGSYYRDHYESHSYSVKSSIGYRFFQDHVIKIGYGFDRVDSPTEFIMGGTIHAYGTGFMDQGSSGPYGGFELNLPLTQSRKFFIFTDLYYYYSKGTLNFNASAYGRSYLTFYRGDAGVEAHSALGYGGIKYYIYKNYGLKIGIFEQFTMSKVLNVNGFNYDNGYITPMIRTNKNENWNNFRGVYIAFTTRI